jgi:hypothetical protein
MATRTKNPTPPPALPNGHDPEIAESEADIVVDGVPDVDVGGAETQRAAEVDPGVAELRSQLEASERRARNAEAEAARLASERNKDQAVLTDSRLLVIESTITSKETEKAAIMRRMKDAKEAGDYDAETNAAAELAEVTLDLKQAKLGKDRLENEVEEAKTRPAQTSADPLENWLGQQTKMGEQSKAWLREHRDYVEDPEKNAELTLAHTRAVKAGHKENSPGYFAAIETELGLNDAPEAETETVPERRGAEVVAPVGRSGQAPLRQASPIPGITVLGPNKYRVSKEIAEAAQMSGVTVKQYVEEALKLQRGSDGQLH